MSLARITPQHPLAKGQTVLGAFALCFVVLMLWRSFPSVDIAISNLFFAPAKCGAGIPSDKVCGKFPAIYDSSLRNLRTIGLRFPQLILLGVVIWGIANLVRRYDVSLRFWQGPVVGLIAMALGPIAIVNFFFKTHIGRARPYQLEIFGKEQPFSLPGEFADNCTFNCSFPSGEAAGATWLLFIIPFLPRKWRWPVGVLIVAFIVAVSSLRVMKGRHFPSDVTMGIAMSLLFLAIAFWLTARVPESWHRWRGK